MSQKVIKGDGDWHSNCRLIKGTNAKSRIFTNLMTVGSQGSLSDPTQSDLNVGSKWDRMMVYTKTAGSTVL